MDLPFVKNYLAGISWDYLICADAGLDACRGLALVPDLILGDFDSVTPEVFSYYQQSYGDSIQRFPAEKDETDTELALYRAIAAGAKKVTILGGTGSRIDHVLGNIQLLKYALDQQVECVLLDKNNRIRLIQEAYSIRKDEQFGTYLSLLPFTPVVEGLCLTGFAYNVNDFSLECGKALGVSNQIASETAEISFQKGILIVIESRD